MVKQGYKQTEVGVIPEDWDCVTLLSKCNLLNGLTYSPNDIANNGLLVLRSSNVQDNQLCFLDNVYVNLTVDIEKLIQKDDIVVCVRNGSSALIGKCAKASKDYNATFGAFMAVLRGKNNYFIFQLLQQGTIQKHISRNSGATINQITNGDFKCILVPFPSDTSEAKRIADALSDVDGMISSLEKLIAKKKAVKQGAMQELLTGKKRLPGFSGEWQESTLGALCYLITKQTGFDYTNEIKPSLVDINSSNTLPFVQNKDFEGKNVKTDYYIPYDIAIKYPRILLDETCLLISLSGRIGNVGLYEKSNGLAFIGGAVGICRFKDEQSSEWCMLYLQSSAGQKQIFECQKSGAQHNLTVEDVRKLVIKLPSSLEEQTAIASILSDMDNEIEALEQKLEKARQIKQGMMQQLLTGKIRLV